MTSKSFFFTLLSGFLFLGASAQESLYDTDLLDKQFHKLRREALRSRMPSNSVAVFFTSPLKTRSNDVSYQFHQDPDFYYLTGYTEPNGILLVFSEPREVMGARSAEVLFVQPRNPDEELWTGRRLGKEGAQSRLGFSAVFLNHEFDSAGIDFRKFDKVLVGVIPEGAADDREDPADVSDLLNLFVTQSGFPGGNTDNRLLYTLMGQLRQEKQPQEIALMRKAINMTCEALKELMRAMEPGMTEYQAQAIIEYGFKKEGSEYPGFPSIVGGGENSCILHYETNRRKLVNNDMLVSDVGAEYHGYSADVTRTIPVNGKFSPEQKIIYNLVLEAQTAGIKECRKGNSFFAPGIAATEVIRKGLLKHGIIREEEDYRMYFPHGTSHYLGLDVHDAGMYENLLAGDVITVEPGIYIPEGSPCDRKWWNIGVRIEDDILITATGHENLSEAAPRTVEEIEALMKEKSVFSK